MQKVIFWVHLALQYIGCCVAFNDGISHKFDFYFQFHLESDNSCTLLFHIGFSNEISKYFMFILCLWAQVDRFHSVVINAFGLKLIDSFRRLSWSALCLLS